MKKFEYKKITVKLTETDLNKMGREGWELVTHTSVMSGTGLKQCFIFKRPRIIDEYIEKLD